MPLSLRTKLIVVALVAALVISLAGWFLPGLLPQRLESAVRRADTMVLYEGLPHPMYEEDLLARERQTKSVRELNGYPFYQERLTLDKGDAKRLSEVLGNPASWQPFSGEKLCGGFHPDYAVEVRRGAARWRVLICFGCGEVKIFGPWGESRYDIKSDSKRQLHTLFQAYRQSRPTSQHRTELDEIIMSGF